MWKREEIVRYMQEKKLIAILRGIAPEYIIDTANALYEGGVRFAEVTFRPGDARASEDTLRSIALLRDKMPEDFCVGAGTVLEEEQVVKAKDAGAQYIISPNVDKTVIGRTRKEELISLPGAFSPTEIQMAVNYGADMVKVFPAGTLGSGYMKAVRSSMSHLKLLAVGGVGLGNMKEFLDNGADGLGIGGELVSALLVQEGRYQEIQKRAKAMTEVLQCYKK